MVALHHLMKFDSHLLLVRNLEHTLKVLMAVERMTNIRPDILINGRLMLISSKSGLASS